MDKQHRPREECVGLIRRWGGACSAALLDPLTHLFAPKGLEGLIGFRGTANCRVVFGDPIGRPEEVASVVERFHRDAHEQRSSVVYLAASQEFSAWALEKGLCRIAIPFGDEVVLSTAVSPRDRTGTAASLVRRKVRHATNEGVRVFEYHGADPAVEAQIEAVAERWRAARRGFQVYISHLHLFEHRDGKRWFVASHQDRIIGTLVMNRLEASQGWAFNHLCLDPEAPGGTPESLVVLALETLRDEQSPFVTFGAVPGPTIGEAVGLGPVGKALVAGAFRIAFRLFPIEGRRKFLEKFAPTFAPSQLLFSADRIGLRECVGLARAMNMSLQR